MDALISMWDSHPLIVYNDAVSTDQIKDMVKGCLKFSYHTEECFLGPKESQKSCTFEKNFCNEASKEILSMDATASNPAPPSNTASLSNPAPLSNLVPPSNPALSELGAKCEKKIVEENASYYCQIQDLHGMEYRGNVSKNKNGKSCQNWSLSSEFPTIEHNHYRNFYVNRD